MGAQFSVHDLIDVKSIKAQGNKLSKQGIIVALTRNH